MLMQFLTVLGVCFLLGKLHSKLTGQVPQDHLGLGEFNDSLKKSGSGWLLLIPVMAVLLLVYNIALTAVSFLITCLSWLLSILKWIWNEVVLAAGWRLLKVLFHYLIFLPWTIFKLAFETMREVLSFGLFRRAFFGIFIASVITILGRFLLNLFGLPVELENLFLVASLLPIGMAIASILWHFTPAGFEKKASSARYYRQAVRLLAVFFGVVLLALGLLYLGSMTTFRYTFSALLMGGELFASLFVIVSAFLLLFLLSALPAYSLSSDGDQPNFLSGYFRYLLDRWYHYVVAFPAAIIPILLVCAIPLLFTKGASFLAQEATTAVYQQRINEVQASPKLAFSPDYLGWTDIQNVRPSDLKKLFVADVARMETEEELKGLQANEQALRENYMKYSSPAGAFALGALAYSYDQYAKANKAMTEIRNYQMPDPIQPFDSARSMINANTKVLVDEQTDQQARKAALLSEYEAVCAPPPTVNPEPTQNAEPNPPVPPQAQPDYCEIQRKEIRRQIDAVDQRLTAIETQLERNKIVAGHLQSIKKKWNGMRGTQETAALIGDLLLQLWMALLWAVALGLGLGLFALLSGKVHIMEKGNPNWYFMDEIAQARAINANQPLLGIVLILLAILLYSISQGQFGAEINSALDWLFG